MIQITSVSIADHKISPKKALMHETLSLHKDNAHSKPKGVVIVSEHHNKILCQSPKMLAFKSMQRMHFLKAFSSLHFPYFAKYPNNKNFKHSTKSCLKYF